MTKLRIFALALLSTIFVDAQVAGALAKEEPKKTERTSAYAKSKKPAKATSSGLAGSEGNVRRRVLYTREMSGGCGKMYKQYVAASGHSAFASTPIDYFYGSSVCATALNAPSAKAAEERAMASCRAGAKKYKSAGEIGVSGACEIFMSK